MGFDRHTVNGSVPSVLLDFVVDLFVELLAVLWRALVGVLRFIFRFDLLVDLLAEFWIWLRDALRPRRRSPPRRE